MRLLPRSLVGRNALFVTLILILNEFLWFGVIRPLVFNRFVQPDQINHPQGILRLYVEFAWAAFALLICTIGVYVTFFWLRRQLQSVVRAAQDLGRGRTPQPLAETGPKEICELSRGFNQLAVNLEALDADRRLMLAGLSHDLSTPLTRLRLAVELAQLEGALTDAAGMTQDIEDMHAIIQQFVDYAKSGKEEEPAMGDLNHVIADACRRYADAGREIRITPATVPPFSFRALALRRAIANLVDNAVRYSSGEIEVTTVIEGTTVRFSVLDRGPGIRSMDPQAVIKPFVREDAARGAQRGAGLGLSIVERIAKIHGGHVTICNRTGGGLAATVTMPVA
jgi:two-component system, OmpR family, osmolarity sensor histidine kinase EnvZ